MAKRGRPRHDRLEELIEDAAVRWMVEAEREQIKNSEAASFSRSKPTDEAQRKIARDSERKPNSRFIGPVIPKKKMTAREVREAHERFGRRMKKASETDEEWQERLRRELSRQ
jgi:hypothetical protein